ncbi:MAG: hypothetical protein ACXVB9_12985 [Bdellovibrionota bacterium]
MIIFTSHSLAHTFYLLQGRHPKSKFLCPMFHTLAQGTVLFDQVYPYFVRFRMVLKYPEREILFPLLLLQKNGNPYFRKLFFVHWPFTLLPENHGGLLRLYFCQPSEILQALVPASHEIPQQVELAILAPDDKVMYREKISCRN